jgi:hypothetical protein
VWAGRRDGRGVILAAASAERQFGTWTAGAEPAGLIRYDEADAEHVEVVRSAEHAKVRARTRARTQARMHAVLAALTNALLRLGPIRAAHRRAEACALASITRLSRVFPPAGLPVCLFVCLSGTALGLVQASAEGARVRAIEAKRRAEAVASTPRRASVVALRD